MGLAAPRVLAADLEQGLLLLDDLGDAPDARDGWTPTRASSATCMKPRSTCWFISMTIRQCRVCRRMAWNEWLAELRLFPEWYVPAVGLDPVDVDGWDAAWREVLGAGCRLTAWGR